MTRLFPLVALLLLACREVTKAPPAWNNAEDTNLRFDIQLNPEIYRLSNFGEPPQLALWLESLDGSQIRTLYVTSRLGRGIWVGKVVCPTALPCWISRREHETGGDLPSFLKPLPDGITGATPKDLLSVYTSVEAGSTWRYFLELNVSGDYNETFPASLANGEPDPDGNGQPSVVYSGEIATNSDSVSSAMFLGRMRQISATQLLIPDSTGLTTVLKVLKGMQVSYSKQIN